MAKKGNTAARLCYVASALMENRNGLIVDTEVEHATGTAERDSALALLERLPMRKQRRSLARGRRACMSGQTGFESTRSAAKRGRPA